MFCFSDETKEKSSLNKKPTFFFFLFVLFCFLLFRKETKRRKFERNLKRKKKNRKKTKGKKNATKKKRRKKKKRKEKTFCLFVFVGFEIRQRTLMFFWSVFVSFVSFFFNLSFFFGEMKCRFFWLFCRLVYVHPNEKTAESMASFFHKWTHFWKCLLFAVNLMWNKPM